MSPALLRSRLLAPALAVLLLSAKASPTTAAAGSSDGEEHERFFSRETSSSAEENSIGSGEDESLGAAVKEFEDEEHSQLLMTKRL